MIINKYKRTPNLFWVSMITFLVLLSASVIVTAETTASGVKLQARAWLLGAYDLRTGLMRDEIRGKSLLPTQQPFSLGNNSRFDYSGSEVLSQSVLAVEGNDAIVDWVLLELRSAADSNERLAAKAFLIQRDGDIVDAQTGDTTLHFPGIVDGNYFIVLRHRNHLSVMSKDALALSTTASVLLDMTSPSTPAMGANARYEADGFAFLWPGDADDSNTVINSGPANDSATLLQRILSAADNTQANGNFIVDAYFPADFDLNGSAIYSGPDNDWNVLQQSILLHPDNQDFAHNYIVRGQAPEITTDSIAYTTPQPDSPNILLIISDDQGLDASAQYSLTNRPPNTPVLNALANEGLVFDNAWATPGCTTTRSSIITGKYGIRTGVTAIGDSLPASETILHKFLAEQPETSHYRSALIGKWHLGGNAPPDSQPNDFGVPYYAGMLKGSLSDYEDWEYVEQGESKATEEYATSKLTDLAIDWVGTQQDNPWFLWLAYNAPHTPYHLPPADLQTTGLDGIDVEENPRDYYLAAIEALDTEIGRLLDSLPQTVRDNTLILYIGDNGSPPRARDRTVYANTTKGTLSEGGLRVPMLASGFGVNRAGERESALINATDFFATITDVTGAGVTEIHDAISFKPLFTAAGQSHREQIYVEFDDGQNIGYAIKDAQYKYIRYADATEALYDLITDPAEDVNLIGSSTAANEAAASLFTLAQEIRGENTSEPEPVETIDISDGIFTRRTANCADYVNQYRSLVTDVANNVTFNGEVDITISGNKCVITANGIPNHDFNDQTGFPNNVTVQNYRYEIPVAPAFAATITPIMIGTDNGIMLNGAKLDQLAAACHGVGNEKIGCGNGYDWRFDPLFEQNGFRMDSHNAHTQPDGSYHYHGSPKAMFSDQAVESPVIGFAADGFPIFGSWINDNGTIRKVSSAYRLKSGDRSSANGAPGGVYDGTFRDDYEYVSGAGDLDECNGMTLDGAYGYYVTDDFPYVMACFKGSIDPSF